MHLTGIVAPVGRCATLRDDPYWPGHKTGFLCLEHAAIPTDEFSSLGWKFLFKTADAFGQPVLRLIGHMTRWTHDKYNLDVPMEMCVYTLCLSAPVLMEMHVCALSLVSYLSL